MKIKAFLPILIMISACSRPQSSREGMVQESADRFFLFYKKRDDWQGFQDLYADELVFEDVIFRYSYNKQEFINFYNWPDPLLSKHPDYPETMVLQDLALTDSSAVGRGYFTPFYYDGVLYENHENMRFTIWLYFDQAGKITRHIDFIEYPPVFLKAAAEGLLQKAEENK